jgi:hypothetical protein
MSPRVPKYRLHKGSGQAVVEIDGRRIYLGKFGTGLSEEKFRRLVAEHFIGNSPKGLAAPACGDNVRINEVILSYWQFAET